MTGKHIWKLEDGTWSYPNHEELLRECRLLPIEAYIARRRGTLKKYLTEFKSELLEETNALGAPSGDSRKVLWGRQECLSREEM